MKMNGAFGYDREMPSPAHETLLVLLREHPAWLGTLMSVLAGRKLPDGLTPIDATVRLVDPAEVRPDLAFVVPAKSRAQPESWVLLESQLDKDEKKRLSWPLAVTAVWNERGPGDLVIITASKAVAAWARKTCRLKGPFGTKLTLTPIVLALTDEVVEKLLDPGHPELGFFAAWAMQARHGVKARRIVERAVELVDQVPEPELRTRLVRSIMDVLNEKMIEGLKELVMNQGNEFPRNPALR
ncbi:MAG: hypothetical protein HY791_16315, partial [Deltaproteobacteria bacterium]|nr:hypothetical protein [Deltaproteobacteria bacterium]